MLVELKQTAVKMSGNHFVAERKSSLDVRQTFAPNLHVVLNADDQRYDVQGNGNAQTDIVGEVHAVNLPNFCKGVVDEVGHFRRNYVVILKNFLAFEVDGEKFNFGFGNFAKGSRADSLENFSRYGKLFVDVAAYGQLVVFDEKFFLHMMNRDIEREHVVVEALQVSQIQFVFAKTDAFVNFRAAN